MAGFKCGKPPDSMWSIIFTRGLAGRRGRLWKGRTTRQAMEGQDNAASYGRAGRRGRLWKDRATRKSMEGQGDVAVFVFVGLSEQSTPERGERVFLVTIGLGGDTLSYY